MIADGAFTLEAALAMRASLGAYVQPAVAAASEDMAPEAARLSF